MKIRQKLILGFVVIALSIVIAEGIAIYYQNEIIKNNAIREIDEIKYHFLDLEERDIKILAASLEVFDHNQAFKDVYLEKDREKLYNYGQPLFRNLKDKNGITHFYFILPDGHCFVRLHDKNIYGDLITRHTFCKARDTKNMASGIELGKTAFALRVVMPYYNNSELIGYVEFGEEVNHFLKNLKGRTNNEFAMFADKDYLDREDWKSVRQVAGLRDNWDDLEHHVIIGNTLEGKIKSKTDFFVEENIDNIEKGKILIQQVQHEKGILANGGFEIKDAGGRHIGALLCLIDITDNIAIVRKSRNVILSIVVILFIICLSISLFISNSILNPIVKLMQATIKIGKGELGTRIKIESKDELGYLASSFNKMVENMEKTTTSIENLNKEIAERKKAQELQIRLSAIIEATSDFIGFADAKDKHVIYINKAGRKMIGVDEDEDVTKLKLFDVHPEWANKMLAEEILPAVMRDGMWAGECAFLNIRDRREIPVSMVLFSHKASNGEVEAFSTISRDITERKQVAENIKRQAQELDASLKEALKSHEVLSSMLEDNNQIREKMKQSIVELEISHSRLKETQNQLIQSEKLRAVGTLASGVAHEVKNPLAIIMQSAEYLTNKVSPEHKEIIQMITTNIKRADTIVRTLVDFSRISELKVIPEDINLILESSLVLIQHRIRQESIKIIKEFKESLPKVLVDKNKIEQVFVNILINAIQAMPNGGNIFIRTYTAEFEKPKGGVGRRIEDFFKLREKVVAVEVEDTGEGIKEENMGKVFEPFFTTKGPGVGIGLGLAVTSNIITMHKGLIEIKSKAGEGTKVTVTLKTERLSYEQEKGIDS